MNAALATERRISALVIVLVCAVFAALLLTVPALYPSFDEAKYIGIGYNVLAGHGVVSVYGPFLDHSPLWSVTLVAPDAFVGIDPLSWGHLLNGIAGVGLIGLTGYFGWRYRPAAGALAAAVLLAFTYLHDQTRTARLDVPVATLCLLFLAVGLAAIRRDSIRWGVLAGLAFAVAFLVKEIVLPFAPVPLIAGLLIGRPLSSMARVTGAMLLAALVGTSWWFVVFASYTHQVYRLGFPASTLLPLGLATIAIGVACLAAPRMARSAVVRRLSARVVERVGPSAQRRWRGAVGWVLAIAWFVFLVVSFAHNPGVRGSSLFSLAQWRAYAVAWVTPITIGAAAYAIGAVIALWPAARGRLGPGGTAVVELALAILCSSPLVLLVIAVGEPPRNYLAEIGLLVAMASCGWIWLVSRIVPRLAPVGRSVRDPRLARVAPLVFAVVAGAAVGIAIAIGTRSVTPRLGLAVGGLVGALIGAAAWLVGRRAERLAVATSTPSPADEGRIRRRLPIALAAALVAPVLASSAILGDHVHAYRGSATGEAQLAAVRTVTDWIDTNVPAGTPIAFGSHLGYQMSLSLKQPYPITQVAQVIARYVPDTPLGIGVVGSPAADDWVSVDIAPRNAAEFQAFQASTIAKRFAASGARYWIYTIGTTTAAPTILAAIDADDGLTMVAQWKFSYRKTAGGTGELASYVFRVDGAVTIDPAQLFIAPDALDRLLSQLEGVPGPATTAVAARLLERVVIAPAGAADGALMDRLRHLAGR